MAENVKSELHVCMWFYDNPNALSLTDARLSKRQ